MKKQIIGPISLVAVLLVLLLAVATVRAETLYVQRATVEIKQGRGAFYPTIFQAKQGDPLDVLAQESGWYQVQTPKGPGWVFGEALAAKQNTGFNPLASILGTSDTSELDKTAGFKGFDKATEQEYIAQNKLGPQLKMVDNLQKPPFTIKEFERFQKDGSLDAGGGAQ